jgi:transposase
MFGFSLASRIFLYSQPTDMRKGFSGLSGLVANELHLNPVSDGAFVFVNRRRDRMKILVWDRHGFWQLNAQLEAGRFQMPPVDVGVGAEGLRLSYEQLVMIIEGIDLISVKRKKRYAKCI